jgi:hypothetical protein
MTVLVCKDHYWTRVSSWMKLGAVERQGSEWWKFYRLICFCWKRPASKNIHVLFSRQEKPYYTWCGKKALESFPCLFMYGSLTALLITLIVPPNGKMVSEYRIWKERSWSFTLHHLGICLEGLTKKTINLEVGAQAGVISKYKSDKASCSVAPHPGPMAYINKPTTLKTLRAKG